MKSKEFIQESQVDEIAPFLATIGRVLAGGTKVAGELVKGAAKTAATTAATTLGTKVGSNLADKVTGQSGGTKLPQPIQVPGGTKIAQVVSKDPNKLAFKIGDVTLTLDPKDPENQQSLKALGAQSSAPTATPTSSSI